MAAKKTTASTKKVATKKAATKKAAPARTSARSETAAKANTPKAAAAKKTSPKATTKAPKRAAAIKLNDRQAEFLGKVRQAGEAGYKAGKGEQRTIDALVDRKLLKRGAKDKESGTYAYVVSKTGEKYLTTQAAAPAAKAEG